MTNKLDNTQQNLLFSFLANYAAMHASEGSTHVQDMIKTVLRNNEDYLIGHKWEIVWGPSFFSVTGPEQKTADNTMFVLYDSTHQQYLIAIAGSLTAFDWIIEDLMVVTTSRWSYGQPPQNANVADGTLVGLERLKELTAPSSQSTGEQTLAEFLSAQVAQSGGPIDVTVTGHSLGGALSLAAALWLRDTMSESDATVSVSAFANPTIGNDVLVNYLEQRLPNHQRVWNTMDIVPHVWSTDLIDQIPNLYTKSDEIPDAYVFALGLAYSINHIVKDEHYEHTSSQVDKLVGRFNHNIVNPNEWFYENYYHQVYYQHIKAYMELLHIPHLLTDEQADYQHFIQSMWQEKEAIYREKVQVLVNEGESLEKS
ncbi:MAG: hypothetical protein AAF639_20645 [Chloroflexota bacterium]